jgi:hypothetical protein
MAPLACICPTTLRMPPAGVKLMPSAEVWMIFENPSVIVSDPSEPRLNVALVAFPFRNPPK